MAAQGQLVIPVPQGDYAVGYSTTKLIDEARTDPYDENHGKRTVMISLFYPIPHSSSNKLTPVPYMPRKTVEIQDAYLEYSPETTKDVGRFPLVLFSPGLGASRLQYGALAQNLASAGYAVVTVDSTYEAIVVEYPDGSFTPGFKASHWDPKNRERHEQLLAARVEDARFVLTQLGNLDVVKSLVPAATAALDNTKAVIIGHSFGGATAISTLMHGTRFVGAVNMDGSQYGPLIDTVHPVLLFGRGEPSPRNRSNNPTWQPMWEHLKGWRKEVNLKDCEHITFGDQALLMKLSGMEASLLVKKMVGTLDGGRSFEVVTGVLKKFIEMVVQGREEVFEGVDVEFPEVEVVGVEV